jgi:pyruvate formate lyase activating enzyme
VLPYIDAFNIDLKGFTEEYYKKLGGDLETVKTFIKLAAESAHVELTTLIVPGENDSPEEIAREAAWIASVDEEIPLHLTRFFPRYKYEDRKPTDVDRMRELAAVARKSLGTVMLGNV